MRTNLENLVGVRDWFVGVYSNRSLRKLRHCDDFEDTAIVEQIRYRNVVLTDHAWFYWTRGFEKLMPRSGDIITFLATVAVYSAKKGYDYEFKGAIWQQHFTQAPKPIPVRPIPQTLEQAQSVLNAFGYWSSEDKGKQIRITEWNPKLLEDLVLSGWCEMSPNNFDYWASRSECFSRLLEGLRHDRNVMRYAQLASIVNGATVAMFSQDGWGENRT